MQKSTVVVIVVLISLVFVAIVVGVGYMTLTYLNTAHNIPLTFSPMRQGASTSTYQQVNVQIPKESNKQTLAVFNLRPHGDANAKLYSIGFSRALADRLYCAPTGLTQQMTVNEISRQFGAMRLNMRKPIGDKDSIKCGKKMCVFWIVTGDMTLSGDHTKLTVNLINTHSGKASTYGVDGALKTFHLCKPSLQA